MNVAAKKTITPAPRMNVLKDQLKEQRFGLITKVKALREQRQALKGVKGSGQQWAELCAQIDEVQDKIDLLSKSLGLPVKERNVIVAPRPVNNPSWAQQRSSMGNYLAPTKPSPVGKGDLKRRQDNSSQMVMDKQDLDAWDNYQSSPEDFK